MVQEDERTMLRGLVVLALLGAAHLDSHYRVADHRTYEVEPRPPALSARRANPEVR